MKEYYGDAILQDEKNRENIEFFNSEDILSARTLNRPIRELYEEMDRLKNEINNLDSQIHKLDKESKTTTEINSNLQKLPIIHTYNHDNLIYKLFHNVCCPILHF